MCRFYFMTCRYFEKQNKIHAPNTHSYNPIPMELLLICAYTFLGFISLISIIVFLQFEILDLEFFHVTLDSNFFSFIFVKLLYWICGCILLQSFDLCWTFNLSLVFISMREKLGYMHRIHCGSTVFMSLILKYTELSPVKL